MPRPLERAGTSVTTSTEPGKDLSLLMLSRATTSAVAYRASSMRRMRRRTANSYRPYCATNGCTSFLIVDEAAGTAHCEICGYSRRLN